MVMLVEQSGSGFQTEFVFSLPYGYVDASGAVHRDGIMRLATAFDEVQPLADPRVQANPAYVSILVLARVVLSLGEISPVPSGVIEGLFASDFAYLQDLYMRLNAAPGGEGVETQCPSCGTSFALDLAA
jgi:hypothetical protein